MSTKSVLIITDQKYLLRWQEEVLNTLSADEGIDIKILQLSGASYKRVKKRQFSYRIYRRLYKINHETKLTTSMLAPDYRAEYDLTDNGRLNLREKDLVRIRSQNYDFIIRFGLGILGHTFFELGVSILSVHQSLVNFHRGSGAGFWEYAWKMPITGVSLLELNEKLDAGRVLSEARFKLPSSPKIWQRYVNNYSAALIIAHVQGKELLSPKIRSSAKCVYSDKIATNPTYADIIKFMVLRSITKVVRFICSEKRDKKYAVASNGIHFIRHPENVRYYADPAECIKNKSMLVEALELSGIGEIYEVTPQLEHRKLNLQIEGHKSFPRTLMCRGEVYLTCEHTASDQDYQCIWKLNDNLKPEKIEIHTLPKLIDPIFLVDDSGACHVLGGRSDELCSISNIQWFVSEGGIAGPYMRSHTVSLDIAVGRLGGSFIHKGQIYILLQDSTYHYGSRLVPFRVNLTEKTLVQQSLPDNIMRFLSSGVHTLNGDDRHFLVDYELF